MSTTCLFLLGFALQAAAFLIPFVPGIKQLETFPVLVGWILVIFAVRFAYRAVVTIPCTSRSCPGRTVQRGSKPIIYVCKTCEYVEETSLYEGKTYHRR